MRDYQLRATIRIDAAVLILRVVPVANDRKRLQRVSSIGTPCSRLESGAEGGSRTRTSFRTTDFKSAVRQYS